MAMTDSDPHVRTLRANWDVPSFAACIRVLPTCYTASSSPAVISSDVQWGIVNVAHVRLSLVLSRAKSH